MSEIVIGVVKKLIVLHSAGNHVKLWQTAQKGFRGFVSPLMRRAAVEVAFSKIGNEVNMDKCI